MEINPKIMNSHEHLSTYNVKFLHFIQQNPEYLNAGHYGIMELNDPLFKLQPWPTFISRKTKNEVKEANLEVLDLLRSIPSRFFDNDPGKISRYYNVSPDLANYFLYGVTPDHIANLLSRGDFVITDSGLKCIEFNINTNLGGMNLSLWESLSLAVPAISRFLQENNITTTNRNIYSVLFEQLVQVADRFYQHPGDVNIAIVMPGNMEDPFRHVHEKGLNSIYRGVMGTRFNRRGGRVFICNYSQLNVMGSDVFLNGEKVHYIVEWCQGFVPRDILRLFKQEKILICNGAIAWLLSTKINLALLSENIDSGLFSPKEKETIEKYVPWTRKVVPGVTTYEGESVNLVEFMLSNREKLVLKPILGAGGKGIHIGIHTPEEQWKKLVESALAADDWRDVQLGEDLTEEQWYRIAGKAFTVENWLVQEYVEPSTYIYQLGENGYGEHHAVWGFFIFGSAYAGGWGRVLPTNNDCGIINCHQGAKVSVIFEVDE